MSTSGRISGDFFRLLYMLSHHQGILDPFPEAFKKRRGTHFYYKRAAIGLACAQAVAMRIDIAPHKRPLQAQEFNRRAPRARDRPVMDIVPNKALPRFMNKAQLSSSSYKHHHHHINSGFQVTLLQ